MRCWILAIVALGLVASCSPRQVRSTTASPAAEGPLGPAAIRIYPLTHMDKTSGGQRVIVCHIELRDRYGDSVKGLGVVEIQLQRGAVAGAQQTWEIELSDLARNAELYDRATRTYRFQLGDLPSWLTSDAERSTGGTVRLVAIYTPLGAATDRSTTSAFRDEYILSK